MYYDTEEPKRNALRLPIKKKWFDLILNKIKKEEYREIKEYWQNRNIIAYTSIDKSTYNSFTLKQLCEGKRFNNYDFYVRFHNGYSANAPYLIALCSCKYGTGKKEWGAEPNKKYIVFSIKKIIKKGNIK